MNLWVVSAAYGRVAVTELVLAQRAQLVRDLAVRGVDAQSLIVADDENLDVAQAYGAHTLEHPNLPLGEKWNAGIEFACREGAEWVVYIGSDDWMHASLFDGGLPSNAIVTGREIAFVNLQTGRMQPCRVPGKHGVIPWVIPAALLARCRYRPITTRRSWGLDNSLFMGLWAKGRKPVMEFRDTHPLARVDFKSGTNITAYGRITKHLAVGDELDDPWTALKELYPPRLVDEAQRLSEEARCAA